MDTDPVVKEVNVVKLEDTKQQQRRLIRLELVHDGASSKIDQSTSQIIMLQN